MPFSIPYIMVKNVENKQQILVDYSKNPCPNELSDFLKCVTDKQITTTIECKKHYKKYISCIKNYNLTLP